MTLEGRQTISRGFQIARKPKKTCVTYGRSLVYRVEGLLQVNEDYPGKKTIIHISTDFIHTQKNDSRFKGEIFQSGNQIDRKARDC